MPDPKRIAALLQRAAYFTRETPGRTGHVVSLDGAADVFAVGDLHGHLGHFQEALRRADLARHPNRHLVVQEVIHGPFQYPDGSDKSHQMLDLVAALKCEHPHRVHFLPGNHEYAQAAGRAIGRNAGDMNALFRAGVEAAYGVHAEAVCAAYTAYIHASPLAVRTANRVFLSHSLPPADKLACWSYARLLADELSAEDREPGGTAYLMLWGRDLSGEAARGFLRLVDADLLITGHVPCDNGFLAPNDVQLVLDSQEPPAGYCLFPADRPLTHAELLACARTM
jgi:hypothetical protein